MSAGGAAAMETSGTPSVPPTAAESRVPPLGVRLGAGALKFVLLLVFLVVLPVGIIDFLHARSISTPISAEIEVLFGLPLCALIAARGVVRPTRAYGPVTIAAATVTSLFLLYMILQPTYQVSVPQVPISLAVTYTSFLLLLLLVPILTIASGAVTTFEDFRDPGVRLEFDYPP